jgi:cytochrome d ubiquinol oxidase subunit II
MMNSVAPFWDGNETWLVLGGAGLMVAFPLAYALIMPAFYLPIIFMLIALIFRGVAFEFRWVAKPNHLIWDYAFAGGSLIAAFAQGLVLGGLLQGIKTENGVYTGGPFDWLTLFSIFTGAAVVCGYALLGATWLNMKVDGPLALTNQKLAKWFLIIVLVAMAIVSVWTPFLSEHYFNRWFSLPNLFYLAVFPLATVIAAFLCWQSLDEGHEIRPFFLVIILFLLGYAGLAVSSLPFLVPPSITIWDAAADPSSQRFMLAGAAVMLPFIFGYTIFVYWTFRGKIKSDEGYH